MKYKMTQAFYICPRGHVHKSKPSYRYKRKDWYTDYSRPKDTLQFGYGYEIPYYKYAGPKNVDERLFEKEVEYLNRAYTTKNTYLSMPYKDFTYQSLYKEKHTQNDEGVDYIYTIPKTFSVENKYKQFRL